MKSYPALDVRCDSADMLLAIVDDFSPTAVEERRDSIRVFFANTADRNAARFVLASRFPAAPIEVSDEDWARRSQENLQPITIGRLTIVPSPDLRTTNHEPRTRTTNHEPRTTNGSVVIVIVPSMGFGTGHHATTRLCLEALQGIDVSGQVVLDVGTGSGILAIAAARFGAARAIGIDNDADAIQAASENLAHNRDARHVVFELADLASYLSSHRGEVDVVTANLTGALLRRSAADIQRAVRHGGSIVASGILVGERAEVVAAFDSCLIAREWAEDEWIALLMKKS